MNAPFELMVNPWDGCVTLRVPEPGTAQHSHAGFEGCADIALSQRPRIPACRRGFHASFLLTLAISPQPRLCPGHFSKNLSTFELFRAKGLIVIVLEHLSSSAVSGPSHS